MYKSTKDLSQNMNDNNREVESTNCTHETNVQVPKEILNSMISIRNHDLNVLKFKSQIINLDPIPHLG